MSQIQLQLQSALSVFKQENLDKLYFRTDEFKKIFLNLQKFLLENYGCFFQYGKLIQKSSSNLDEYLKNYLSDDKNCLFFAKYISNMFNSFGDDFSKIFYGLNEDLNSILNEIVDKINQMRKLYLDVSNASINIYMNSEINYLKLLQKYKKCCKDAEDSLNSYQESQKEAKSLYNISISNRFLSKVKTCVKRVNKYEIKLHASIELLNTKRKAFSINAIETVTNFKINYKFCLFKFFELNKKNSDALSSFMSMFAHIIHDKKIDFSLLELSTCLPYANDFVFNNNKSDSSKIKKEDWPDFLLNPQLINEINLLDFSDWVQNYVEKVFELAQHRRKILKHLKICVQEFGDAHDNIAKNLFRVLKNVFLPVNWSVVGDQIFSINQNLNVVMDTISKKLTNFANFIQIKMSSLDSILIENVKSLKIAHASVSKSIKDHALLRNNLLKAQNVALKPNKLRIFSSSPQKNIKEIQDNAKQSILETANNVKTLLGDFSKEEKKKATLFKETIEVIISQMEFYYTEIVETLKTQNEKVYLDMDKTFGEDLDHLFLKLIFSDNKINELYKSNFKNLIQLEKDQDIQFVSEFDKDHHPLYQKLFGNLEMNNIEESPSPNIENKDDISDDEDIANEKDFEELPTETKQFQINVLGPENESTGRQKPLAIQVNNKLIPNVLPSPVLTPNQHRSSESCLNLSPVKIRKKSLDSPDGIILNSAEIENIIGNSPRGSKIIKPYKCEEKNYEKSKFVKGLLDPESMNLQVEKNINFDLSTSPKKKKSTYAFFHSKFGMVKDEIVEDVFSCALLDKMLIQGKLFISNKKLGFHSYFNRITLLGETKMIIPSKDILRIEKRVNAIIFDNSIAIITNKGELFFTSFVFRDRAYSCIIKMIQPIEQKDNLIKDVKAEENKENEELKENNNDNVNEVLEEIIPDNILTKLEERAKIVKELVPKDDFFKDIKFTYTLSTKCKIDDVVRILLSNGNFNFKGKQYKNFWEWVKMEKSLDTNLNSTEYEPETPSFYSKSKGLEELIKAPNLSERKIEYIHPLKKSSIPFLPKVATIKEYHKIYWIDHKEIYYMIEVRTEKVPYSDCFYANVGYHFQEKNHKIDITSKMQVTFVKKTYLQGTIEKTVVEENSQAVQSVIFPSMNEWISYIYKSNDYQTKFPSLQKSDPNKEKEEENETPIENKIVENEEFKKKIDELENKLNALAHTTKLNKMTIGILVAMQLVFIVKFIIDKLFE